MLAAALVSALFALTGSPARATCVANTSPTTNCDNLSLSQQYIDANVGSTVTVTSTGSNTPAVQITNTQHTFSNSGTLRGTTTGAQGLRVEAAVTTVTNTGTITGYTDSVGVKVLSTGSIGTLQNSGQINGGGSNAAITNAGGTITTLNNEAAGSITSTSADKAGIFNSQSGVINTISNSGTISGTTYGVNNSSNSTIGTITNLGTITGGTAGIGNFGTLSTLNNLQSASSGLSYKGALPTSYNIIINSTSNYGKLVGSDLTGSTNFGIYTGSTVTTGTYSSVLSGFKSSNLGTTTGTYNGYPWLLNNRTGTIWDLVIGLSTTDTQTSVSSNAASISNLITLKNLALLNGFEYDCPIALDKRFCIAASARYVRSLGDASQEIGSAVVLAVRATSRTRVGLYVAPTIAARWSGSTIAPSNLSPTMGGFIDWKQKLIGGGLALRASVGYEKNPVTITRSGTGYSEPGSGSTDLMSRGAQLTARYGVDLMNGVSLSPYVGIRRVQHFLDGYEENGSTLVSTPLSYSSISAVVTSALAGLSIDIPVRQNAHLVAAAGLEYDINDNSPLLVPSGMTGLTSVGISSTVPRYRSKLLLSYYWLLPDNQRLTLSGIFRQEPYVGFNTINMFATYGSQF